ncbi:MAG: PIN domain-containing protein [Dolichospermum sp.]
MSKNYLIYADICCLCRSLDDLQQSRVKIEAEAILSIATNYLHTNDTIESLASDLVKLGFKLYDALHLAFSQTYKLDIFLTTDDRLLRKAKKYPDLITIKVENPVVWLMNILQEETDETNGN